MAHTATILSGKDPGVGGRVEKRLLHQALKGDIPFQSMDYLGIEAIGQDLERHYLTRWSAALQGTPNVSVERTARAIAAHLLDLGFSADYLHRWWTYRVNHESGQKTIAELVAEAHALAQQPPAKYEVLVAFEGAPLRNIRMPPNWMDSQTVRAWLIQQEFDARGLRQNGGLLLEIDARDPDAAVEEAGETIEVFAARIAIGASGELKPVDKAWVKGQSRTFNLKRRRRGAEVHTLQRENQLYRQGPAGLIDAAIESLRPLNMGSLSSAIAGAWTAVEGLLSGSGDADSRATTAIGSMAAIIACSFPRAEMTTLSYVLEKSGHPLAPQLATAANNYERAALLGRALKTGQQVSFPSAADTAALGRLQLILQDPATALNDVCSHLDAAFRRLYRQRNLVLHGARTEGATLKATVRTTAPLVGAGVDRITRGSLLQGLTPRALAARARLRLETVHDDGDGTAILSLLD